MDQLLARHLGMAIALCTLGAEMVDKQKELLLEYRTEEELKQERDAFLDHARRSEEIAKKEELVEDVQEARDEADEMYRKMYSTFVRTEDDNPTRVLSWLAISHAGGVAVWAVLCGASDRINNDDLHKLSDEAVVFQHSSLHKVETILEGLGKQAA